MKNINEEGENYPMYVKLARIEILVAQFPIGAKSNIAGYARYTGR